MKQSEQCALLSDTPVNVYKMVETVSHRTLRINSGYHPKSRFLSSLKSASGHLREVVTWMLHSHMILSMLPGGSKDR